MGISFDKLVFLFLIGSLFTACGIAKFAPELAIEPVEKYAQHQEKDGFALAIQPLWDPTQVREYFGDDLQKEGLLPIIVVAHNRNSTETYLISKDSISISFGPDQDAVDTKKSLRKASSYDAKYDVYKKDYFPLINILSPYTFPAAFEDWGPTRHSRFVQHNIVSKSFRSKCLSPGQSYAGCIYLKTSKDISYGEALTIVLVVEQLMGGKPFRFSFPVNISSTMSKEVK